MVAKWDLLCRLCCHAMRWGVIVVLWYIQVGWGAGSMYQWLQGWRIAKWQQHLLQYIGGHEECLQGICNGGICRLFEGSNGKVFCQRRIVQNRVLCTTAIKLVVADAWMLWQCPNQRTGMPEGIGVGWVEDGVVGSNRLYLMGEQLCIIIQISEERQLSVGDAKHSTLHQRVLY